MYIFKFADIGEGIHEGKVAEILVKEGDAVKDGTDLFSVETDKITTEVSSPVKGIVSKILIKAGDTIHVGDPIFEIDDNASSSAPAAAPVVEEKKMEVQETKKEESSEQKGASVVGEVKVSNDVLPLFGSNTLNVGAQTKTTSVTETKDVAASPVAKAFAKEKGVDLAKVKGTGPAGRITKKDVEDFLASNPASTTSTESKPTVVTSVVASQASTSTTLVANKVQSVAIVEGDKTMEMTPMRKAIANAMRRSWSSAAYTNLSVEIDVTDIWEQRNKIKDFIFETENVKLNLLPFIVKAIAKTLKNFPMFNAISDDANNTLVLRKDINIGIAVDTKDGLIVPNIKNVDKLSILEIAKAISDLAERARSKKIVMSDLTQGTFSVTNYGSLGVEFGVPVINYPEVAIAGLGSITGKVKKIGIQMVERKVIVLTIAADHRWVDGADIARFGNQVKQYLENITFLFV
ncbi:MAG: 2-oxo acid dehydrogenase subunit E2 [Malacoplasma sp.]|nr:2-oxo acid dehydrogenase subunit E2 [Malacoplasma sp.]